MSGDANTDFDFGKGFTTSLFRSEGKVALIMGGRGDLARAMGATLADLGCAVAFASRKVADCEEIAQDIAARFGTPTLGLQCDIADEDAVAETVAKVIDQLGGLDILVNNAGASWWGLPQDIPVAGFRKVMDVNVTGTFLSSRHAARHMIANRGGSIINIASVGAFISYRPEDGQVVPYTTSKAAIVHLTADLAAQWADHGIRVNAIAPGSIETGMTETLTDEVRDKLLGGILLRRLGRPEEICGALALLASQAGSFMTGQTILVDGGQSLA